MKSVRVFLWMSGVALLVVVGCSKSKKNRSKADAVDEKGRYTVRKSLPERYACKEDGDCAMTRIRPGHCCLTECPEGKVAGRKEWVAAVKALRKARCAKFLEESDHACSYPKCYPKGQPEVHCVKGRCAVEMKPLR